MVIQKNDLLNGLKMAMPGIESGVVVLQGADSFIFHNGRIFSYNDSVSVSVPLPIAGFDIEGAVKANDFYRIVSKFSGDEINFISTEKGTWVLECGKAKVEMILMNFDYESRIKGIEPNDVWIEIDDDFISGLKVCRMSLNKSALSGLFVKGKNIVSTDGWQINRYTMNGSTELPCFWISENSVNDLLKMGKLEYMQMQDNWVHFKSDGGTIFSAKVLNSNGFPYDKVMNIIDENKPKDDDLSGTLPKELFGVIDRAASLSIDVLDRDVIRLKFSKDGIDVSSERSSGKYFERVLWDTDVDDFEPIVIYVDVGMISNSENKGFEFYLVKGSKRNGKIIPRFLFKTERSIHLMSTFDNGDE